MNGRLLKGFTDSTIENYLLSKNCQQKAIVFFQVAQADQPDTITVKSTGDPGKDIKDVVYEYQKWPDGTLVLYASAQMEPETDPKSTRSVWMSPDDVQAWVNSTAIAAALADASGKVMNVPASVPEAPAGKAGK